MLTVAKLLHVACWICIFLSSVLPLDVITGTEECGGITCHNHGRCVRNGLCVCMAGFTGNDCDSVISCQDVEHFLENVKIEQPAPPGVYGDFLTYSCHEHYQLPDVARQEDIYKRTVRCNEDATWGPDLYDCVAQCSRVPTWRGYLVDTTHRMVGTTIRYDCYGFYPTYHPSSGDLAYVYAGGDVGEQTTTCNETGEWNPPLYSCVEITEL